MEHIRNVINSRSEVSTPEEFCEWTIRIISELKEAKKTNRIYDYRVIAEYDICEILIKETEGDEFSLFALEYY